MTSGSSGDSSVPAHIGATGHAVPDRRVASTELDSSIGKEAGWIERRTGIRERPMVGAGEAASDLAREAGDMALERWGGGRERIGLLLLATSTPDHLLPPTGPLLAHQLGLRCGAVDVTGACAGFLYALTLAAAHARLRNEVVLTAASNILSTRVNPADRSTVALFSDGAGAVVLEPGKRDGGGLLGQHLGADGEGYHKIWIPGGGSREPFSEEVARNDRHLIRMKRGRQVFREAVAAMTRSGRRALADAGLSVEDVDWWIPHQANGRIIERVGRKLGIPTERWVVTIGTYGNSSAATIPTALAVADAREDIRRGDILLLTAMGAGLVEAGVVWRW